MQGKAAAGLRFTISQILVRRSQLISKTDADTQAIRKPRGYGFSSSYPGDYVVLQATNGIQFWDWTDVSNPVLLKYMVLPGMQASTGYSTGSAWWVFWQAPYVYIGGSVSGLYVVDASDPQNPVLVKQMPTSQTGGFLLGPVFVVGNLLVGSTMNKPGYVTFDISDPKNPILIKAQTTGLPTIYSILLNGNKILGAGMDNKLYVHSINNPAQFKLINSSADMGGKGGYINFQDGYAHVGASNNYAKVNIRNNLSYPIVGTGTSGLSGRDEDFANVLGNLVFVSSDHTVGSALMPHQSAPDTKGPAVNMVNPKNGTANQAVTSRIGLTFTDQIDLSSVKSTTFIVRPVGGAALSGKYSSQTNIVNFSPDQPLQPNTTYEVVVPAGGIKDYAGNATTTTFSARFSTRI